MSPFFPVDAARNGVPAGATGRGLSNIDEGVGGGGGDNGAPAPTRSSLRVELDRVSTLVSSLPSVRLLLLLRSSEVGEGNDGAAVVRGESTGPFLLCCCRKYGSRAPPSSREDLVLRSPLRRSMSEAPKPPEDGAVAAWGESCGREGSGSRGGLEGRSSAREAEMEDGVLGVVGAVEAGRTSLGNLAASAAEGDRVAWEEWVLSPAVVLAVRGVGLGKLEPASSGIWRLSTGYLRGQHIAHHTTQGPYLIAFLVGLGVVYLGNKTHLLRNRRLQIRQGITRAHKHLHVLSPPLQHRLPLLLLLLLHKLTHDRPHTRLAAPHPHHLPA